MRTSWPWWSHELRIPLTSIKGSATTLLDDAASLDPAEMREFHRIIDDRADYMRYLIADLLDVARIETGTLPVSPEPSDVVDLVDEARNTFVSAGSGNNIRIDLPLDLPRVMADRRRIAQVLGNLLSNASSALARVFHHPGECRSGGPPRRIFGHR